MYYSNDGDGDIDEESVRTTEAIHMSELPFVEASQNADLHCRSMYRVGLQALSK